MAQSTSSRLWKAVKPPRATKRTGAVLTALNRKQKKVLFLTCAVVVALGAAGGVYDYVSRAPERAAKEVEAGMRLMEPRHYADAIARFDHAIAIWPEFANAYFERGVAYQNLNQTDQAMADLDRAVGYNPELAHAYTAQGAIFRSRGDSSQAMRVFAKAIQIGSDADAYFERGQTYESLGEHLKAVQDFDQAIAVRRDAPYVYRARALSRRNSGDLAGYEADRDIAQNIEQHH
jgi:tetratricopeptide (TPR) repeat protein